MSIYVFLIVLIVIAAILMVGIVMIQESKGGGLAANFSNYNQLAGVRKTTDVIEKTTWGLAAFMVVFSIVCAYVSPKSGANASAIDKVENPVTSPSNNSGFEANPTEGAAPAKEAAAPAKEAAAEAAAPATEAPAAAAEAPAQAQ